jgi:hypothetical protein
MNGNFARLDEGYKREFEEVLGGKLRIIYQHL